MICFGQEKLKTSDLKVLGDMYFLKNVPYTGVVYDYYQNTSKISWEKHFENGLKHGLWANYNQLGGFFSTRYFENGEKVGKEKVWHPNGNLSNELNYNKKGELDGKCSYWFPRGQLSYSLKYKNGKVTDGVYDYLM